MAQSVIFLGIVNHQRVTELPTIEMRKMIAQNVLLTRLVKKIRNQGKHFKVNSLSGIPLKAVIVLKSVQVLPLNIN